MTPLTDEEKKAIVATFKSMKDAIKHPSTDVNEKFKSFQQAYRGDSRAYVDSFPEATDKRQWVGQLEIYLHDEIESSFWH